MRFSARALKLIPLILGLKFALVYINTNFKLPQEHYPQSQRCTPQKKIAFLKTHKCGSSTIENILFRYALQNGLNVAVPETKNYLCKGKLFDRSCLSSTPWKNLTFDLFALHTRWNAFEVQQLMGENTKYFSVLRDPVDVFESMFAYMGLESFYNVNISEFIEIVKKNESDPVANRRKSNIFGRNQIAYDWGIPPEKFDDDMYVDEQITKFEKDFDLVLLAKHMDESLVLLRHLLCWPVEYVTHLRMNQRKQENTVKLTEDQRNVLKNWLRADFKIYNHFEQKFRQKVRKFNEHSSYSEIYSGIDRRMRLNRTEWELEDPRTSMQSEVEILIKANEKLHRDCGAQRVDNVKLKGEFREWSKQIIGYAINESLPECRLFAMSEAAYLQKFRKHLLRKSSNTTV